MKRIDAIRNFFQRQDSIAPNGGRHLETRELMNLDKDSRFELAELAAKELGTTIDIDTVKE
jgi:hypothetical protein